MSSFPRRRCCLLAVAAAVFCTAATTLHNPELQFRVTIPDGFERNNEHPKGKDDLYSFIRPATDPSQPRTAIMIRRLRGTLPTDFAVKGGTKGGVRIEPIPITWKTFTLPGAKAVMDVGGGPVVSLSVQVPLKPEAISITVAGSLGDEREVSDVLRGVLASVEGETSWVNKSGRVITEGEEKAEKQFAKDIYICVVMLAVIGFAVYIWRRNRRDGSGD